MPKPVVPVPRVPTERGPPYWRQRLRKDVPIGLGFLVVLAVVEKGAFLLAVRDVQPPWHTLMGLSLALLLGFGLRFLPVVFLGAVLVGLWICPNPQPVVPTLALALAATVACGSGAAIFRRGLRLDPGMQRIRDTAAFLGIAVVVALVPALGFTLIAQGAGLPSVDLLRAWFRETSNLIIVTPLFLLHVGMRVRRALRLDPSPDRRRTRQRRRFPLLRSAVVVAAETAVGGLILWLGLGPISDTGLRYLCFLPLIEVALRHGLWGTTVAVPAIAIASAMSAKVYSLGTEPELSLPLFVLSISTSGLLMGTVVTARTNAERSLQWRTKEMALLRRAVNALISTLDIDQVLDTVLGEVRRVLGVTSTSVWLVDPSTGDLVCRQVTGPNSHTIRGLRLAPGQGLAGWVVQNGRSLITPDARADPRHMREIDEQTGIAVRSVITAPLQVWGETIGALQAVDEEVDLFGPADLALLEAMAATAAVGIESARLYEQAVRDAETKTLLLEEVNHRVKNTLSTVAGLLYAELRHADPEVSSVCRPLLADLVSRIQGLSTVHGLLSSAEWQPLSLRNLILQMVHSAMQALPLGKRVSVEVTPSPVRVTPDQAHHLALVINELAVNTAKHALGDRVEARLWVDISLEGGTVVLRFHDDGPGYPEDVLRMERRGMGIELVRNLVERNLRGAISLYNEDGAVTEIHFQAEVCGAEGRIE